MGNYTPETKLSYRTGLWTVLLRTARFGMMARRWGRCGILQTLLIDQVSGMIWPKNDELFFRPTSFSQLYLWNKKTKQSYTLDGFVASSPIWADGEASGRLEKFANFGHRSGFRHDLAEKWRTFFSDPLYFLNYTPGTKKLSSRTLWNVLLRTARFWPMERLLDVWRSLQTLVIDQVSGMIWGV